MNFGHLQQLQVLEGSVTYWLVEEVHSPERAKEQNAELRELYLRNVSEFESYHLALYFVP